MSFLSSLVSSIILKLASWGFTWALGKYHQAQDETKTNADIDQKLSSFKEAYKQAFNGQPMTVEQKDALEKAISTFLRNNDGGV